jgi:hypothetical protein
VRSGLCLPRGPITSSSSASINSCSTPRPTRHQRPASVSPLLSARCRVAAWRSAA